MELENQDSINAINYSSGGSVIWESPTEDEKRLLRLVFSLIGTIADAVEKLEDRDKNDPLANFLAEHAEEAMEEIVKLVPEDVRKAIGAIE